MIDKLGARRYWIKDQLGSVRAVVRDGTVVEWNDYYAYGAVRDKWSLADGRWKYLGKELDDETGSTHTDAREFFNLEGVFNKPDRFAFKYPDFTPYGYAKQNPFRYNDASGDTTLEQNKEAFILPTPSSTTLLQEITAFFSNTTKVIGKNVIKVGTGVAIVVSALLIPETLNEGAEKPKSEEDEEVFHHRVTSDDTVDKIVQSAELIGYPKKNIYSGGLFEMPPQVKAFRGKLPAGMSGVEFKTSVTPDKNTPPGSAFWSGDRPDIESRVDSAGNRYAVLKISVIHYQKQKSSK